MLPLDPLPDDPTDRPETAPAASLAAPGWSLARRLGFRFCCLYFVLYNLPFPLPQLRMLWPAGLGQALEAHTSASDAAIAWFGGSLLGLDGKVLAPFATGSGDTTRNFVELAIFASLALGLTALWSLLSRAAAHPRLAALLRTYLRYALATTMLGYGLAKFGSGQFPPIEDRPELLLTTWGDTSPMGVVWRFMGASPAYTAFSGLVECAGGLLLLWRRTATLGALVTAGAMTNVALLNYCYDVPVKQYSTHLLAFALWIAGRDLPVLWDALIRHRPTRPMPLRGPRPIWLLVCELLLKYAFVGWLLYTSGSQLWQRLSAKDAAPTPALAGLYEVTEFRRDGELLLPLLTDSTRWRYVTFATSGLSLRMTDGKTRTFAAATYDAATRTIVRKLPAAAPAAAPPTTAPPADQPAPPSAPPPQQLQWQEVGEDGKSLQLTGTWDAASVAMTLRPVAAEEFLLCNRGFHWVQEFPYNR